MRLWKIKEDLFLQADNILCKLLQVKSSLVFDMHQIYEIVQTSSYGRHYDIFYHALCYVCLIGCVCKRVVCLTFMRIFMHACVWFCSTGLQMQLSSEIQVSHIKHWLFLRLCACPNEITTFKTAAASLATFHEALTNPSLVQSCLSPRGH